MRLIVKPITLRVIRYKLCLKPLGYKLTPVLKMTAESSVKTIEELEAKVAKHERQLALAFNMTLNITGIIKAIELIADGEIDHKLFTISSLAGTCKKFLHCEPLELDVSDETLANYELMAGVESKLLNGGCLGLSS